MKLLLAAGKRSHTVDWSGYALIRDNVQHFVEGGEASDRFAALHAIEAAVDEGRAAVDASRLRGEVLRAWYALGPISLDRAAVSLRTRAILTGSSECPTARGTVSAGHVGWALPAPESDSRGVAFEAERFVKAVLSLTEAAVDGDVVEVRRVGAPPRFAARARREVRARAGERRPGLARFGLKALMAVALTAACGTGVTPPPAAPDVESEQKSTHNGERTEHREVREPVVAPPPAYGNKVVRQSARGERTGAAAHH